MASTPILSSISIEGGLFPSSLLGRLTNLDSELDQLTPAAYGCLPGETLRDAITDAWNRLQRVWVSFAAYRATMPADGDGTGDTRQRWLLPFFQVLGYGDELQRAPAPEIGGKVYRLSHLYRQIPIHLIGCRLDLDKRIAGAAGAAASNAHGLVQEFLNRSTAHQWGMVSNGLTLRLLRDNASLTRQAYLEVDLEALFDQHAYHDFVQVWLLLHSSRFKTEQPGDAIIDRWYQSGAKEGVRVLETLQTNVRAAIEHLGKGFLTSAGPGNRALREALAGDRLSAQDYYRELLRTVYRLLFCFVAEDRNLLLLPTATKQQREHYNRWYATGRLRRIAANRAGTPHGDGWKSLRLLFGWLGSNTGCPALGVPALGSMLWSVDATPHLDACNLSNQALFTALRALAVTHDHGVRRSIDFKNLGAEELGGIYESLLELHPEMDPDTSVFILKSVAGSERKTTGSYYTPTSLIKCLLDAALDPLLTEAVGKPDPVAAILNLKIVDPACGSGHFLVAAAHRVAKKLAAVRTGDLEPAPDHVRHALRDVIARCIYGVDLNPMSVELCKVSLWLEALDPGTALAFLDHRIRCGNSVIGATPQLVASGVPDAAFTAIDGDDKTLCTIRRKANLRIREGGVKYDATLTEVVAEAAQSQRALAILAQGDDGSLASIAEQAKAAKDLENDTSHVRAQWAADAWCAAFLTSKQDAIPAINTESVMTLAQRGPDAVMPDVAALIISLRDEYRIFHWHLSFPEVFTSVRSGFDLILGNPPWETLSPDQREFYGKFRPGMRSLSPKDQESVIAELTTNSGIKDAWDLHSRQLFSLVHFLKNSGRFTLYSQGNLGKGDFNIYRMFVELALRMTRPSGYAAQIVPAGLYGGANASAIRKHIFDTCQLRTLMGCENKGGRFFPGVHPQTWFCMYVAQTTGRTESFHVAFGVDDPAVVERLYREAMPLDAGTVRSNAPDTYALSDVRNVADLTASTKMYARYPAFGDTTAGPPTRHYQREIDMGNDRDLFTEGPEGLPVYEGRMLDHFDHRAKTYESGHGNSSVWIERLFGDPAKAIVPQWRVLRSKVPTKLGNRIDRYRIGFGDVANPRNERSFTACLIPPGCVSGHKVPTIVFDPAYDWAMLPWLAIANSFVMDWLARSRLTAPTMSYTIVDSLPFPRPKLSEEWAIKAMGIALRLVCTTPDFSEFWNSMAKHGLCQPIPEKSISPEALLTLPARFKARAQLDAIIAHDVYGLTITEMESVMESFPVVKKRDFKAYGCYRTKDAILNQMRNGAAQSSTSRDESVPVASITVLPAPVTIEDWAKATVIAASSDQTSQSIARLRLTQYILGRPALAASLLPGSTLHLATPAAAPTTTTNGLRQAISQSLDWAELTSVLQRTGNGLVTLGSDIEREQHARPWIANLWPAAEVAIARQAAAAAIYLLQEVQAGRATTIAPQLISELQAVAA